MDEQGWDLNEVLRHIDPAALDYLDWTKVGMVLKHEGYPCSAWEQWSRDDSRFHEGECEKKWKSFGDNTDDPVTSGTLVQMAKDRGWVPAMSDRALAWDDYVTHDSPEPIIKPGWVEGVEIRDPETWNPADELIRYLAALFEPDEHVGYVMQSVMREDGRYSPRTGGHWDRTAGQLIDALKGCHGDIGAVLGDYDPKAGAWIRFNPLDGNGCKNENVEAYRFALVEADPDDGADVDAEIAKQNAIIREMKLPVAALVHSGNKSLHAIVRVDAPDYKEYRKRVEALYEICKKNGLNVDTQNKNPSRLSRMPGVTRGGKKQYIVDVNIGAKSWGEWLDYMDAEADELPDTESLSDVWGSLPPLAPPLIEGVLRQGHKMLLAGPSKAGKSFALIELCIAIAEGRKWLAWGCAKGRVLYVNLELDRASCLNRFKDVYDALGIEPAGLSNIDVWNLRGKSVPMDKLAPKLIRRAQKKGYIAVVIDPIYKVITGDENSADQMAKFCNYFDKVCTELGCAVIYCHHHSKGLQGGKRSMDRASGSGVFGRDPDALLDMIGLDTGDGGDASPDRTAWRIEGTLREFPALPPVDMWFEYPVHALDVKGELAKMSPEAEKTPWEKGIEERQKQTKEQRMLVATDFAIAYDTLTDGDEQPAVPARDLADYLGYEPKVLCSWLGNGRSKRREEIANEFEKFTGEDSKTYIRKRKK